MHLLLTNDDGPLDDKACPYLKYLVDEILTCTDWDVSIVVPNQQRSWIGKAHFAGKTLTSEYIYTKISTDTENDQINAFEGPFPIPQTSLSKEKGYQEWCLIDSTPAACADIGIHHLYPEKGPVDLVLSGPNFGKNSSSLYILTSGTVGAAMEAVTHGIKAIALSYSFNSLDHNYNQLKEAAKISVKLVAKLYKDLQSTRDIDLFSVNIPLVDSLKLGTTKIHYAPIFQNKWQSIYSISEEKDDLGRSKFNWTPDFKKVYKDGLKDTTHSDSRVLLDEGISVTPLKASFCEVGPTFGELTLDDDDNDNDNVIDTSKSIDEFPLDANLQLSIPDDSYIASAIKNGFSTYFKGSISKSRDTQTPTFHYADYEELDFDNINDPNYFLCSYVYRKALIRKHFLANTIRHYIAKNPDSILSRSVPESFQLEVDYAEFLDDALDDCYELRQELEQGGKTWIVKPSMSDKGQGIRVFRTIDQLQSIFDSFEEEEEEEEENENEERCGLDVGSNDTKGIETDNSKIESKPESNGIILSQLRHFIVQEYKDSPLLLEEYNRKKFHLRVYVVASGATKVYVYKDILALFSDSTYVKPDSDDDGKSFISMDGHLTNTCLQENKNPLVVRLDDLKGMEKVSKDRIIDNICEVTKEVFTAALAVDKMNFQPLANGCEIYGVDFLVDTNYEVTLLEVNAYPDFKQTGDELRGVIDTLFDNYFSVVRELMGGVPYKEKEFRLVLNHKSHNW